ncbi:MAG: peptidylprolyl isomerase [Candidatus Micrarchaeota archaeon]
MMGKIILLAIMALLFGCIGGQPQTSPTPTDQLESLLPSASTAPTATQGDSMSGAQNGDKVSVYYAGTLEDGTLFDTNIVEMAKAANTYDSARPYTPLEFTVGAGEMIKGFDAGVIGMKEGETKTITMAPKDAYGELRADLIQKVPIATLKAAGIDPKPGQVIATGSGARGVVREIDSQNATIDFNHFLAGQALTFKVTMEKITKGG